MSLSFTGEQEQIQREARRFLTDAFSPETLRSLLRERGAFDTAMWRACVDMGWTGAGFPEEHGGLGLGALEVCLIAEECGRVATGAPFLGSSYAVGSTLLRWGDGDLRNALLPALAGGGATGAIAVFEGEDGVPEAPQTAFGNGRLFGVKPAVAGGGAATHAIVYAMADKPILTLVDLRAPGVTVTLRDTYDNSRCTADLRFEGVEATALNASDGRAAALDLLARWATVTAFEQIGGAEAAMHRARDYANERQAFGQPIGKFQAIKHRIAEMFVAIELARGNALLAAAGLTEDAPDLVLRAAAARLTATQAYEFAASESIQTHGAIGATWEHDLHLFFRRSRTLALEAGSRFFWEDLIVDALQDARA